ncbi:uncharacterized protein KY384_007172 [Bacidia gigantensis]|uniref:uncharacterized protein n=1 Tax=Bacidia gigantensis TaxID=2732470 RepID=UPI001D043E2F|nr:uncharacterized protein KY384_007172 [Bacidia gigantensis]KAG8528255.1 hypothetical protein KY384_007172 [Bacidia gigantensis]
MPPSAPYTSAYGQPTNRKGHPLTPVEMTGEDEKRINAARRTINPMYESSGLKALQGDYGYQGERRHQFPADSPINHGTKATHAKEKTHENLKERYTNLERKQEDVTSKLPRMIGMAKDAAKAAGEEAELRRRQDEAYIGHYPTKRDRQGHVRAVRVAESQKGRYEADAQRYAEELEDW